MSVTNHTEEQGIITMKEAIMNINYLYSSLPLVLYYRYHITGIILLYKIQNNTKVHFINTAHK